MRKDMQTAGTYKEREDGSCRPWGGVNVVYVGDFLQIPPAGETSLTTPPSSVINLGGLINLKADEGLEPFWNHTNNLIIFKKQMRFEDLWWLQVCDECRRGCLSQDSWAFLHGHDTSVSGSWLDGQPQCAAGCMQQIGGKI